MQVKRRNGWRMSCDVGEVTERLGNEQSSQLQSQQSSFSNLSVVSHTSQLILQPFRRFTYVTAHSPTLSLLHLRHTHSPTLLSLFLRHRLFTYVTWRAIHVRGRPISYLINLNMQISKRSMHIKFSSKIFQIFLETFQDMYNNFNYGFHDK